MHLNKLLCVLLACLMVQELEGHYLSPFDLLQHDLATVKLDSDVVIAVNTTVLEKSGQWVEVSWRGVAHPDKEDWIGVYSPPVGNSIDPVKHAPIKFQYASYSKSHDAQGAGSLKFRLVNMREDVIMGFFKGGLKKPVLLAVSQTVSFKNPNEPLQGHLSLTPDPTQMILSWVSKDSKSPQVKWGSASGQYTNTLAAQSSTYTDKDMCGSPATDFGYRETGTLHQITIPKLTPGEVVYYRYGDDGSGWSDEYMFKGPLPAGWKDSINVVAYGDMGNGQPDDSRQYVEAQQPALNTTSLVEAQVNSTDLVLHIGDISYARGYASVWDEFFDLILPVATRVPYMVCLGNHERDFPDSNSYYDGTDSGGECGVPHERRFPMPRPSLDEAWYEFDYGPVHFMLMSTEHNFTMGSPQYSYIAERLSMVNRSITPWLVFSGHRPMYIDSTFGGTKESDLEGAKLLQENIEPLLMQYKADLVFWGHHHSYQRTCPVYKKQCTPGAPIHVVIGMGGQGLSTNISPIKPKYFEVVDDKHYGYSRFSVNMTTLVFEFIRDTDGQVQDQLVLHKK